MYIFITITDPHHAPIQLQPQLVPTTHRPDMLTHAILQYAVRLNRIPWIYVHHSMPSNAPPMQPNSMLKSFHACPICSTHVRSRRRHLTIFTYMRRASQIQCLPQQYTKKEEAIAYKTDTPRINRKSLGCSVCCLSDAFCRMWCGNCLLELSVRIECTLDEILIP